jgi:NAD(P)-dependent dehydrogenase (short-subunit alcohol dehydrogenase family)
MAEPKSILITGCSSGIGLAAARTLRDRGYRVFASCRRQEDVARLRDEGFSDALVLDLNSSASIQAAVEQVLAATGGELFALFNNGAYGLPGAVEDLSRDALRRQFETNVFGTHELTCRLLPAMLQQPDARIIQNSSVLGLVAMFNRGAYIASKFALEGLTDTLRLELRGTSVKVVLIEPGPILSQFRKNALARFQSEVDFSRSRHKKLYEGALARLSKEGPAAPFTLPPSAVVDKLLLALEKPNPKPRYYVTFPTYLMGFLRRLLPTRLLDRVIARLGSG